MDELEKARAKHEKKLGKHDKYLAQLGRASDASFNEYMDMEIFVHERQKARAQALAHEQAEYSDLTSAEFNAELANIPDDGRTRIAGLGTALTLDEAMTQERTRRADGGE